MAKRIILLSNLGSPDSPAVKDVRKYLSQFLMDGRVIDIPLFFRFLLVRGIIVPFRAPKSAEKYKGIWEENESPLLRISHELNALVGEKSNMPTYLSMRYGNPSAKDVLKQISKEHPDAQEVVLFPLYPHYAMSSYETGVEHVRDEYKKGGYNFALNVVAPYYNRENYISALAESIKRSLPENYDHLLFSYHGVPERQIIKSDVAGSHCLQSGDCCSVDSAAHQFCYRHQVLKTTELVAKELGLKEGSYSDAFQSRLGRDKWLEPATTSRLKAMPSEGIKNLVVVCPAFVADCLETIEEIADEGKEDFLEAGGEQYHVIPCLNSDVQWAETIVELVNDEELRLWPS